MHHISAFPVGLRFGWVFADIIESMMSPHHQIHQQGHSIIFSSVFIFQESLGVTTYFRLPVPVLIRTMYHVRCLSSAPLFSGYELTKTDHILALQSDYDAISKALCPLGHRGAMMEERGGLDPLHIGFSGFTGGIRGANNLRFCCFLQEVVSPQVIQCHCKEIIRNILLIDPETAR